MKKLIKAYTKLCKAHKKASKALEYYKANPYIENCMAAEEACDAADAAEQVVISLSAKVPDLTYPDRTAVQSSPDRDPGVMPYRNISTSPAQKAHLERNKIAHQRKDGSHK